MFLAVHMMSLEPAAEFVLTDDVEHDSTGRVSALHTRYNQGHAHYLQYVPSRGLLKTYLSTAANYYFCSKPIRGAHHSAHLRPRPSPAQSGGGAVPLT